MLEIRKRLKQILKTKLGGFSASAYIKPFPGFHRLVTAICRHYLASRKMLSKSQVRPSALENVKSHFILLGFTRDNKVYYLKLFPVEAFSGNHSVIHITDKCDCSAVKIGI